MTDAEKIELLEGGAGVFKKITQAQLARIAKLEKMVHGYQTECREVEQTLGQALGAPWYKDDPKNFPDYTEADGVCVGEHTPATIAADAATKIKALEAEIDALEAEIDALEAEIDALEGQLLTYKEGATGAIEILTKEFQTLGSVSKKMIEGLKADLTREREARRIVDLSLKHAMDHESRSTTIVILAALAAIDSSAENDILDGAPIEGAHKRAIDRYRALLRDEK